MFLYTLLTFRKKYVQHIILFTICVFRFALKPRHQGGALHAPVGRNLHRDSPARRHQQRTGWFRVCSAGVSRFRFHFCFSQFDWCAWIPNTPCTMRQPPPRDKDAVTMETVMATLPDISQSCMQMAITWHLGRPQPDAVSLSLSAHPSIYPIYTQNFPLSRFHWATTPKNTSQRPRPLN